MDFDIRKICDYDISSIKEKVLNIPEEHWTRQSYRQDTMHVHSNTQSILLKHENFEHYKPLIDHDIAPLFEDDIHQLEQTLFNDFGPGRLRDVTLVKLLPNSDIGEHYDGDCAELAGWQRCHLPIITNENVIFHVGETSEHLKEGKLYQIDNLNKLHSVENKSDQPRIHMMLEYFINA